MSNIISAIKLPNGDTYNIKDEISNYAVQTGSYEALKAGGLTTLESEGDEGVYSFRKAPTLDYGYEREIDKLIGGTVAWNQLQKNTLSRTNGGLTYAFSNGEVTISNTATDVSCWLYNSDELRWQFISGHKYLIDVGNPNYVGSESTYKWYISGLNENIYTPQKIISASSTLLANLNFVALSGADFTTPIKFKPIVIDLTALFGSAEIADYVYSLEQTTAGAGVAWLRNHGFIDGSYRAYDSGSLQSVKTSEHRTSGKNLLDPDKETSYSSGTGRRWYYDDGLMLHAGITYTFSKRNGDTSQPIAVYIIDKNNLDTIATATNTVTYTPTSDTLVFLQAYRGTTYAEGTVFQLEVGSTATEYEPYHINSYPLDSDLELRGVPKLDNGSLYYDGDIYESNGAVTRKYRKYTSAIAHADEYGTLGSGIPYYGIILSNASDKIAESNTKNIISNLGYVALGIDEPSVSGGFRAYAENEFLFYDTRFTSKAVAQQMLDSLEIVYIAKAPTTETADPYANPQLVSPYGTEEYVDTRDIPVPVGHSTTYLPISNGNKLDSLPSLRDGQGPFLVAQDGNRMKLVEPSDSGVTAGTYGGYSSTPAGFSYYVPKITVDSKGVVTSAEDSYLGAANEGSNGILKASDWYRFDEPIGVATGYIHIAIEMNAGVIRISGCALFAGGYPRIVGAYVYCKTNSAGTYCMVPAEINWVNTYDSKSGDYSVSLRIPDKYLEYCGYNTSTSSSYSAYVLYQKEYLHSESMSM